MSKGPNGERRSVRFFHGEELWIDFRECRTIDPFLLLFPEG